MVALCMLVSCEQPFVGEDEADVEQGNLTVRVFQIEKTPFAGLTRGEEPVVDVCTRLNYAVYDEGGSRVRQLNQTSDAKDFGTASFRLEEGNYMLVVVAHSANGNPTMTNPAKIQFTTATGYTDTFLCSGDVSINDEPVDMQVMLDRIASMCRFVITDDSIPAEVKKMRFYYTGGSGAFDAATGLGSVNSKQTVTFDVTDGQKQFDLYTFLHATSSAINLKVTALDGSDNVLYERDFDVPMEQNHITWLSGAYFSGSSSSSSTISGVTVNTDWAGETHLTF
jgi:hypothetical protein